MKNNFSHFRSEFSALPLAERIFLFACTLLMIYATVTKLIRSAETILILQLAINILSTVALFITHILFRPTTLLGGISLKAQKYISLLVLLGSFFGQYVDIYRFYQNFDTVTHFINGISCVMISYHLYVFLTKDEPRSKKPTLCSCFCLFASLAGSCFWEIFEFVSDFLIGGTCQYYSYQKDSGKYFYLHQFPFAVKPEAQIPLYDTMIDLIAGFLGACIAVTVLYVILHKFSKTSTNADARISVSVL